LTFCLVELLLQFVQDDFVNSLDLPIALGVFDRGCYGLDIEVIIERLEASIDELSVIVSYYCVRHVEPKHNTSPYKFLHVLDENGCEWLDLKPFGEIVDSDEEVFYLTL